MGDSEGGNDVTMVKDGVLGGEEVMSSEETTIAGELGPCGIDMIWGLGESVRGTLWWVGAGTSSVSRRCCGRLSVVAEDEDTWGSCKSKGVGSIDSVLARGLRGDFAVGVAELPSIPNPDATLLVKLAARERRPTFVGVTLPSPPCS